MNKEAKNMEAIYKAKQDHDNGGCEFGGVAVRLYMSAFDIERMGWEEGDNIAGMTLQAEPNRQTMTLRVECDAEPKSNAPLEESIKDSDLVSV